MEGLLPWCEEHGVQRHGIKSGFVAEGWRGVLATQDLPPGTCVLRVPERLLLSVHSAARDAALQAALQHAGGGAGALSSVQVLACHLLHELSKGEASFWRPYLQSLPEAYTLGLCFGPDAVAQLQDEAAERAVEAAVEAAQAAWRQAAPALAALRLAPKWRSRGAWLWAAATLSSRTMHLPSDPAGALTPFGDLHNYASPPPPCLPPILDAGGGAAGAAAAAERSGEEALCGDGRLDEGAREYCIYARRGYRAGEQVFLCYGRHTNLELLLHYGFVLPDNTNPHDVATLSPARFPAALAAHLAGGATACELHAPDGVPSWGLLRALRLGAAGREERRAGAHLALADRPISAASERRAFEALRGACEAELASLPTSLEEDEALAGGGGLEGCSLVAVQWRMLRKRTIARCVGLCARVLARLPPEPP